MKKAFIYVRVSTEEQAKHGFSISAQQNNCLQFATKNDYQVTGIYMDEGKSAKNMERPQLQTLLKDIKNPKKKPEALIVWRLDRITRNNEDYHARIKPSLRKNNVLLLSATESNDFDNPMGDFFRNLGISQAELERYIISARVKAATKEKAEQGYYPRKPPIGYKSDIQNGKKIIIPDPAKAHYIKKAYELYATGTHSFKSIEELLRTEGFECDRKVIENIFNKFATFYTGQFNWDGKQYQGKHERIVSNELYHTVMSIKNGQNQPKRQKKHFIYRGIIKCEVCGRNLTSELQRGAHNSGEYIYYHCSNDCINRKRNLNSVYIDEAIKEALENMTLTEQEALELKQEFKEILNRQRIYDEKARVQIESKITTLKNRLNKLYDEKIDGEISGEFYNQKKNLWQSELDELTLTLSGLLKSDWEIMEKFDKYIEPATNAYSLYSRLTSEKKSEYLKIITSNLFYNGSKIVIEIKRAYSILNKLTLFENNTLDGSRTHV